MAKRGFTLIELLIVMAILTLLAGILFTVFAGAKEKARQTHCMNNLKQLGAAILLYKQDYDGGWPQSRHCSLFPHYVQDRAVFVCPDDATDSRTRDGARGALTALYCSYTRGRGDYLLRLSGWEYERVTASANCELKFAMLSTQPFTSRFPMLVCRWHLLPGSDVLRAEFTQQIETARIQAPILKLNQDGSVVRWMVPTQTGGYENADTTLGVIAYSREEAATARRRARELLRAQGGCDDFLNRR